MPSQRRILPVSPASWHTSSATPVGKRKNDFSPPFGIIACFAAFVEDFVRAVAPGQSVVLYQDGMIVGGGIIARAMCQGFFS